MPTYINTSVDSIEAYKQYFGLLDGTDVSPCPLPCTQTKTRVSKSHSTNFSLPIIRINFLRDIAVTKTDFLDFSLNRFLSSVGGSLGLWLGLGMVQLGELGLRGARWLADRNGRAAVNQQADVQENM